jgi:hypothetical protein
MVRISSAVAAHSLPVLRERGDDPSGRRLMRGVTAVFCAVWAVAGSVLVGAGFTSVNSDARVLVVAAGLVGVGAAALAAWMAGRGSSRLAGALLVVSIVTPTWAAAIVNVVPLVVGLALLLVGPTWSAPNDEAASASFRGRGRAIARHG